MAKFQIHLIVDIEAVDGDDAHDTAERLGEFLGLHHLTATEGTVTEVLEIVEDELEEDGAADLDEDAALDAVPESHDVEGLIEVAHAMDDRDFVTNFG
jgi:hypothetical protein